MFYPDPLLLFNIIIGFEKVLVKAFNDGFPKKKKKTK